ncbi:MAG: ethanolamine utilization microcompartment protein EutL, partial [Archangium sp.]|nr:ethanolamine utilization microcompartment protein EutL [Archangium sp.]
PQLARALGLDPKRHVSAGLITCDQDDSLYAALDHATKYADVDVVYAKSFYAGSAHASGPLSGEIMGILAGPNPSEVAEGLWALREALTSKIHFVAFEGTSGPAFFPHVIAETGRYLAPLANIKVGQPMAYLIAPPQEALIGIDAALKAANVTLQKFFGPPTETNFAGAYLTGSLADVEAAARAFTDAVESVVSSPLGGLVRPERERR